MIQAALVSQKLFDHMKVWIGAILKAFECETIEMQFNIGSYRIDLYFPDEFGHSDRTQAARQMYIEKHLSCKFARFNPDAKDFDVFK